MIFWYSFTNDSFNYWMMHSFQLLWIFIKLIMKQPIFDSELRRLCPCVWLTFCEHSVNVFYIHTGLSSALNPYIDFLIFSIDMLGFPDGASGKEPSCQWRRHKTWVQSLGQEDPLEEAMATHSTILAWRIPCTEEPGGLHSMGLQRVSHDWSDLACMHIDTLTAMSANHLLPLLREKKKTHKKTPHTS